MLKGRLKCGNYSHQLTGRLRPDCRSDWLALIIIEALFRLGNSYLTDVSTDASALHKYKENIEEDGMPMVLSRLRCCRQAVCESRRAAARDDTNVSSDVSAAGICI
jgi:hypothetical protein